jgi:hypothetical protein
LVGDILRVEFEGNETHISKLTYKCMRHKNMKLKIDIDPLETINILLIFKYKLVLLKLALLKFCSNMKFLIIKISVFYIVSDYVSHCGI